MTAVLFDAPGPRARLRNRVISVVTVALAAVAVWAVVARLADKGQLTAAKWRPFLTGDLWRTYVLPGIVGTLTAAALSIVLAGILGFALGVGRLSPMRAVRIPCAVIVEFFRADHGPWWLGLSLFEYVSAGVMLGAGGGTCRG